MDYSKRFRTPERKLRSHEVALPDTVLGWFVLRGAGLDKESKQLIVNRVGDNLSLDKVEFEVEKTFGLDSLPSNRASSGAAAYHVDDCEEVVHYGNEE
eukprot:8977101-Pyramimonas_sp.AAC.1